MGDEHHGPMMQAAQDPQKNEYGTPPTLWRPLSDAVDGFDLDPCSGAEGTPIAPDRYTKSDDGLRQPWHGDVFVNPPWSSNGTASAKHKWLSKARSEARRSAVSTVTVLIPSDTSTEWFHEHVMAAPVVCFVGPGRISFQGEDRNPSFGLLIPVYGDVPEALRSALNSFGTVVEGRETYQQGKQATL